MGESPSLLRGRGGRRAAGDGFPFARERRLAWGVTLTPALSRRGRGGRRAAGDGFRLHGNDGCVWHGGVTLTPALSRRGRGGRRAAGDGFPFARERRVCVGSHPHPSPLPSRERGTACRRGWVPVCTGTTVGMGSHPHSFEGEGDGVPPGMGSRLHGNDGWHGESPSPPVSSTGQALRQAQGRLRPLPSRERGTACRRGWVPVCTGTTVGMGSPASPPVSSTGQALRQAQGRLRPLPPRERGTACRRGWVPVCTGTTGVCGESPSLLRGRGGRRGAGDGFPFARERRVCVGSHPHPPYRVRGRLRPLPSRKRGTACRRGWVPVCTGTTVWVAGSC